MTHADFFTDQNRTLGPFGGYHGGVLYQLSEKKLLTKGSLSTQVRHWGGRRIYAIEPGKISD